MPRACELVLSVRVDEPDVAVILIEVELVVCQLSVMLCPSLIDVALEEKTRVGAGVTFGGGGAGFWPEHEQRPKSAIGAMLDATQRKLIVFIRCMRAAEYRFQRTDF